ncbi:hypothetical protein F4604DRAFT_1539978, partial [Suillus subluteus]
KDSHSSFWTVYKKIAKEKDQDFLEQHTSDMDIVLSGLFSTISTSFIVAMEPNLSPDPNNTMHALLLSLTGI